MANSTYLVISPRGVVVIDGNNIFYPQDSIFSINSHNASVQTLLTNGSIKLITEPTDIEAPPVPIIPSLAVGPQGPQGVQGFQGPAGPPGVGGFFLFNDFTPTNGQTIFSLSGSPSSTLRVYAILNGVQYNPGTSFSLSGMTNQLLTWSGVPLLLGDTLRIYF